MFKKIILFNIFIGLFCYSELFSQTPEEYTHFIIDLNTILSEYPAADAPIEKTLIVDGENFSTLFRIVEWGPEFLQYLSEIPNIKMSFFSYSELERSIQVIQKIKLPNGKTAIKIVTDLETGLIRLFGMDLFHELRFFNDPTKDFNFIPFENSLKKAIFISPHYSSIKGLERNTLYVETDESHDPYPETTELTPPYKKEHAIFIRNELLRITGIIQKVIESGNLQGNYLEALANLLWKEGSQTQVFNIHNSNRKVIFHEDMYQLGNSILSKISSK